MNYYRHCACLLITMQKPTAPMTKEAAKAGFYKSPWGKHPRLQIRTIAALLGGKGFSHPPLKHTNVTFKKAPKAKASKALQQGSLALE